MQAAEAEALDRAPVACAGALARARGLSEVQRLACVGPAAATEGVVRTRSIQKPAHRRCTPSLR
eukprot:scaffold1789_cov375-Prasinococcus_capsulatus_cf.AAC.25